MFWPYAIDVLDRERGTVDGLRPVFFTGFDSGNVEYEQFLFGDREGSYIEFGAQQCILVRDDAAREKLRDQVGDIGLIMTLYESKGLEFNDVLLYNFFEDSTVGEAQWRVVLNALETRKEKFPAPLFDKARHAGVCVELKFLYVAITRARNNVWIADTSAKGEPMRILWSSKDQVQNCTPGTDTPRLAISSTAAEWEEQGRKLFANKRYRQSKHCFERAFLPREAASAGAYYLRQEARKSPGANNRRAIETRKNAFLEAAAAFLNCAREDQTLAYFRIAAECFEDAGDDLQAAQTYQLAKEYTRSTELYRKLGKFDEAVFLLKNHREEIRPEVVVNITNVARLFYFKEQKLEKANALFTSYEEALEYLEDRGLDIAHASLLESLGRFSDAAEIHLEEGRTFEAIKLFLRDRNNENAMRRGIQCILQGFWQRISFAVSPDDDDPSVSLLLTLAAKADVSFLSENDRNELAMFQSICRREIPKLELLGEEFEATNPVAALVCLDLVFTNPPKIQALHVDGVAKKLQTFYTYVRLLNLFTWADPCHWHLAEKLCGYVRQGENDFLIPEGTFLHSVLRQQNHPAFHTSIEENVVIAGSELRDVFRRSLINRLEQRVQQENEMCKRTKAFTPCLLFSVFDGNCNRVECPNEHVSDTLINPQQYNLRVRIHLQQILIYQTLQFINNDPGPKRYWISRLYSALYPSFYRLGSASCLDLNSIPEAVAGFQVVKEWIRTWVYEFRFMPQARFLGNLCQVAKFAFQFDRKDAMTYLTKSPFMLMTPSVYLRTGARYVVSEFISSLEGKEETCISAGVLFVRHVVNNELPIHISILCDIMEHLCACIIVADRQQRGVVNDITLPLSWLVNWTSIAGEGGRRTDTFPLLAADLATLLKRLYSGDDAEHLLFDNKDLANLGWRIRDTFFARICRCLCLLAYNSSRANAAFRSQVLRNITYMRRTEPNPRRCPLSHKYITADSWQGLVRAVRTSTAGSPLDEMVVLLYGDHPRRPIRHVRQITYNSLEDIPQLLGSSRLHVENAASDEQHNELGPAEDDDEFIEEESFPDAGEAEEVLPDTGPVAIPALEAVKRTDEEISAASVIQRAFKRVNKRAHKRTAELAESSLAAGCAGFFMACLKEAGSMEWPNQEYRLRFLGPLPHLLLCLDIIHTTAQKQKKQIKSDLREAKHEKLEALDKQLTQVTITLKQIIQMQKALGPKAAMHRSRDLGSLKSHASKAVQLMRSLPFKVPEGLSQHLERAYKGIVQPRIFVQAAAQRKPVLNLEEEYH